MTKLTRLSIKQFRNVAPTTLEFRPGLNVLLGRNAAGKTTLLRLLATVVGAPETALRDEPFEVSYRASSEALNFEQKTTRFRISEPLLSTDPDSEEPSNLLQEDSLEFYENEETILSADILPGEISFSWNGERFTEPRRFSLPPFLTLINSLVDDKKSEKLHQLATTITYSRALTTGRMDESLERFNSLLKLKMHSDGKSVRRNLKAREIPHSLIDVFENPIPEGTTVEFALEFLDRAAQILGYESASVRFDVERLSPTPTASTIRLSNLRFFFKKPGEEISHDLLSYGQKRLLAFFAHADASPDIILADELVNGLHHEWIAACLKEIGERQAFLTSQNPLLLDFLRFDSIEDVRRTFILCERSSNNAGSQLIWRNFSEDEAESFFLAYQAGMQRVSDILLTKGLW
ncbi:MAG: hypothetical protein EOO70_01665 [Myxococcaceae bacterium]|nr:MAG: hypothetical protein EOO70_01665 [Myxococcaceae bacterium]